MSCSNCSFENDLFKRISWRGGQTSALSVGQNSYGSKQREERLELMNALSRHSSLKITPAGAAGRHFVVWDLAYDKGIPKSNSGYNILQTKFIDGAGCLDFVYFNCDGQVRRTVVPPSGSSSMSVSLYSHSDAVWCVVVPNTRNELMSAGMDSAVKHLDLRTNTPTTMLRGVSTSWGSLLRFLSIDHHPYAPEFCLSGFNGSVLIYDKRNPTTALHNMLPRNGGMETVESALYNHRIGDTSVSHLFSGTYLYDSRNCQYRDYVDQYENAKNELYDYGHIFICEKITEPMINFIENEHLTVVCLEPYPRMPVLTLSGSGYNVKIWTSCGLPETKTTCSSALKERLRLAIKSCMLLDLPVPHRQLHYSLRSIITLYLAAAAAAVAAISAIVA